MHILVAADDCFCLTQMKDILLGAEHCVLTAKSGEEALQKAIVEQPDLIILDVIMPGLLGTEVAETLRMHGETASIPIWVRLFSLKVFPRNRAEIITKTVGRVIPDGSPQFVSAASALACFQQE